MFCKLSLMINVSIWLLSCNEDKWRYKLAPPTTTQVLFSMKETTFFDRMVLWFGKDFPKLYVEEEKNARSCKLAQPTTQDLWLLCPKTTKKMTTGLIDGCKVKRNAQIVIWPGQLWDCDCTCTKTAGLMVEMARSLTSLGILLLLHQHSVISIIL